jgi:hypothetical protein
VVVPNLVVVWELVLLLVGPVVLVVPDLVVVWELHLLVGEPAVVTGEPG